MGPHHCGWGPSARRRARRLISAVLAVGSGPRAGQPASPWTPRRPPRPRLGIAGTHTPPPKGAPLGAHESRAPRTASPSRRDSPPGRSLQPFLDQRRYSGASRAGAALARLGQPLLPHLPPTLLRPRLGAFLRGSRAGRTLPGAAPLGGGCQWHPSGRRPASGMTRLRPRPFLGSEALVKPSLTLH